MSFASELKAAMKTGRTRKLPRKKIRLCNERESHRWRFVEDGVRQSSIELWLQCREQFRLRMAEGLRKEKQSASIDYGNLWHWLLARAHDRRHKMMDFDRELKLADKEWTADNPGALEKQRQDWQLCLAQTRALWPFYVNKFNDDWHKVKWECVEEEFDVKYSGVKTHLRGIWDGVFTRGRKQYWLREIKTKSRIDEYEIEDCLHLNWQVMLYLFTIRAKFGVCPKGVEYNVIRKPETRLKADESLPGYAKRLQEEVRKNEDHYFKRWEMTITDEQLDTWERSQLKPMLLEMKRWAEGKSEHFINTAALTSKFGRCEMFDVITKGSFTGVKQDHVSKLEKER